MSEQQKKPNRFRAMGTRFRANWEAQRAKDTRLHRVTNRTRSFTTSSRERLQRYGKTATKYQGKFDQIKKNPNKFTKSMKGEVKQAMGDRNPMTRTN